MSEFDRSLRTKKAIFLDLDGTVYLGDKLINGAARFLAYLRQRNIAHYFLSNNSSRSKKDYATKLSDLGIQARSDQIILSTDGVIEFLKERRINRVYVVGTESMKRMFQETGINPESSQPEYVILGYDTELTYDKLKTASLFLQNDIRLIATHCDLVCPTPDGPIPDVGSMLALFEKATGKKPFRIFGKPNPEMIAHVLEKHKAKPQEAVMIGDRIYTDMELANRIGCDFILVLSGETQSKDTDGLDRVPALVVNTLGDIILDPSQ
ncbi:HAD-IIA family hydrolase [Acidobacteriota bacterium]